MDSARGCYLSERCVKKDTGIFKTRPLERRNNFSQCIGASIRIRIRIRIIFQDDLKFEKIPAEEQVELCSAEGQVKLFHLREMRSHIPLPFLSLLLLSFKI